MILVVGGKFQGKLDFVKENFDIDADNIFDCEKNYLFNLTYKSSFDCKNSSDYKNSFDYKNSSDYKCSSSHKYSVVDNFESYILKKTEEGLKKLDLLVDFMSINFQDDTIIICDDISNGLVPIDTLERAYRENLGHLLCHIAKEASEVYSVLYGIGIKI